MDELIKALRRLSTTQDTDNSLDWVYGSQQAMHDSADALEAAEKRIAELEAQFPKGGEWIEDEYGYIHCSKCGMEWDEPEHPQTSYCPNCGARMKTVTDCHTLEEGER